jgi:hypothetical protein
VDDKQALAVAIGKHRGDVPHARDLLPGKDLSKEAAIQGMGKANDSGLTAPTQRDAPIPYPEKYLGLSL